MLNIEAEPIQYGVVGGSAELRCTAAARPTPTITWFRVLAVNEYSSALLEETAVSSVFSISTVQASDAGSYKCEASYIFGTKDKIIQFIVLSKLLLNCVCFVVLNINFMHVPSFSSVFSNRRGTLSGCG